MSQTKPEEEADVADITATTRRGMNQALEQSDPSSSEGEPPVVVAAQIMAEIRQALDERRRTGELVEPDMGRYHTFGSIPIDLQQSLRELNTSWDQLYEPLKVESRTPLMGDLWAAIRRRIHEEVRSYLDPMIWRQSELNAAIVRSLNALAGGLYGGSLARDLRVLYREVVALRQRVQSLEDRLLSQGEEQAEDCRS